VWRVAGGLRWNLVERRQYVHEDPRHGGAGFCRRTEGGRNSVTYGGH
jgi:hypothetical protein